MGVGETVMKIILVSINLLFMLAGGVMLTFGIIALVDQGAITNIVSTILPLSSQQELDALGLNISGIITSNAIFMIILGSVTIVIAIFGFVGACCMVRWMLVVYAIILILLLVAEIALIIFAAVYTEKFRTTIQAGMYESLKNNYRRGLHINGTGHVSVATGIVELAWDAIQFKEGCCGAYNYTDYKYFNWTSTVESISSSPVVPITCCKKSAGAGEVPTTESDFQNLQECVAGNPNQINSQNCYDKVKMSVEEFISQYKFIAIGVAVGICVLELLLIIFSFVLCSRVSNDKYV